MIDILCLGSNHGDRINNLNTAITMLSQFVDIMAKSSLYETPAIGNYGDPYYNCVVAVETEEAIDKLNIRLKEIERALGRDDEARRLRHVPVDIDIVMANDCVVRRSDFNQSFFKIGYQSILRLLEN